MTRNRPSNITSFNADQRRVIEHIFDLLNENEPQTTTTRLEAAGTTGGGGSDAASWDDITSAVSETSDSLVIIKIIDVPQVIADDIDVSSLEVDDAIVLVDSDGNGTIAWDFTAARTLTLPDADDTLVGRATSDTLTNKTINADNNTLSNLVHGSEVDNPSSGVHGVTGDVVGTTDSQTVTNKILSSVVSLSVDGATTLSDTLTGVDASLSSTLDVDGATTLNSTLGVDGDTTVQFGNKLNIGGTSTSVVTVLSNDGLNQITLENQQADSTSGLTTVSDDDVSFGYIAFNNSNHANVPYAGVFGLTSANPLLFQTNATTRARITGVGDFELLGGSAGSDHFSAGSTGWQIGYAGAGELEALDVRSALTVDGRGASTAGDVVTTTTTVADSTTEETVYTATVGPGELEAGRMYKVTILGRYSTANATDTFDLVLNIGSSTISTITSVAASVTDGGVYVTFFVTVRSTGATGEVVAYTSAKFDDVDQDSPGSGPVTIDTTASQDITATVQWSAADAGNTLSIEQGIMELLN